MRIAIVIPTYNERENITTLIPHIFDQPLPAPVEILVVDDNSPDGTGIAVQKLAARDERVRLLSRPKKMGLGPAYVAGFREVLARNADLIFEMDADLSHDPKYLPAFIRAAENADVVLGSRYVPGGKMNIDFVRRIVSRLGNYYARFVLGGPIHDFTTGYRCYRRNALERIDFNNVHSVGYVFQIELAYRAVRRGLKVAEIPIVFTERKTGASKFNGAIMLESFKRVLEMRFKK